jgi:hypothetical protein
MITKKEFSTEWKHFCECIDFGRSNLDAQAICFMNTWVGEVVKTLAAAPALLEACKIAEQRLIFLRHYEESTLTLEALQAAIAAAEGK